MCRRLWRLKSLRPAVHIPWCEWFGRSPLRSEVVAWTQAGCGLDNVSDDFMSLKRFLAALIFAPCNSQYVEGEHARIKRATLRAPHHSDAYVSLSRRMPAIATELETKPELFDELVSHLERVPNAKLAVQSLGLEDHSAFEGAFSTCTYRDRLCWEVVYRGDAYSKYMMPEPAVRFAPLPQQKHLPGPPVSDDGSCVMQHLMAGHLAVLSKAGESLGAKVCFSMPLTQRGFHALDTVMQGEASSPQEDENGGLPACLLEEDVLAHVPTVVGALRLIFWKPSPAEPSRLHRPRQSKRAVLSGLQVVTSHRILGVNRDTESFLIELQPMQVRGTAPKVESVLTFHPAELDLRLWGVGLVNPMFLQAQNCPRTMAGKMR